MPEKENESIVADRALSARSVVIRRLLDADVPPYLKLLLAVGVIVIANWLPSIVPVLSHLVTGT